MIDQNDTPREICELADWLGGVVVQKYLEEIKNDTYAKNGGGSESGNVRKI